MSKLVCVNWSIGVIRQQMRCIYFAMLLSAVLLTTCTNIFGPPKKFQYAGSAWDELKHIRQAIGFLVSVYFLLPTVWLSFLQIVRGDTNDFSFVLGHSSETKENIG